MKVAEILKIKGHAVMTVRPAETIKLLTHRLRLKNVGAMIVSENGSSIDGIISERDVAHGLAEHGNTMLDMPVAELMTRAVVTCTSDDSIADVAKIMTQRRIRHLPVQDGTKLVGVISVGDVVKHRLDEMELEAHVLRDYVIASH